MAISFDKALGIHQHTLGVRAERAEVLSSNIANADTPNYKAQDLDFEQALAGAKSRQSFALTRSHEKHFDASIDPQPGLKFRVPLHPDTGDGNTVDLQTERNLFMQNTLEHQMSLGFLDGKFSGLKKAIRGD
ncbi:flagellar basal body rod protein FlgB [Ferrimonas balearica]|uniref:flagellar basal body rod protein FlgB n=1 Tax=Ferrimonas balearica TaxID=44012 RepID=UPI001C94A718|nr:flagellar basal body rod protein FlgB [Ferrimonas balearica]MBY6224700.1 flagellar basal body rod protein FlgB [Ferrimonas balearica]